MKKCSFPATVLLLTPAVGASSLAVAAEGSSRGPVPLVHLLRDGVEVGTFSNLEDALGSAIDGDELALDAGTFSGPENRNLQVEKDLTIRGAGPDLTLLDCGREAKAFRTQDADALFEAFTIRLGWDDAEGGGGIAVFGGEVICEDLVFDRCVGRLGGGIAGDYTSSVVLRSSRFRDNLGILGGGGAALIGEAEIVDCEFTSNWSSLGGAIYVSSGAFPLSSPVKVLDSSFLENTGSDGGAIALVFVGSLEIDRCQFLRNSASNTGGGVFSGIASVLGECVVRDSVFAENVARFGAGGLVGVVQEIVNCTIVDNQALSIGPRGWTPGGVHCGSGISPTLVLNSIVRGNLSGVSTTVGQQVSASYGPFPPFSPDPNGLVFAYSNVEGASTALGNFDADPLFRDAGASDYHLLGTSPCRDAGFVVPGTIGTLDLDGEPRVQGATIDVGADEITVAPPPSGTRRVLAR